MATLGQFTQYYLISIILPGFFNLFIFYLAANNFATSLWPKEMASLDWTFATLCASILTLAIGMLFEKPLFPLIQRANKTSSHKMSYDEFSHWRKLLLQQITEMNSTKAQYHVFYTEQVIAKYYCFNNILAGLILVVLMLLLILPMTSWWAFFLYRIPSLFCLTVIFQIIRFPMRIWLNELEVLQSV